MKKLRITVAIALFCLLFCSAFYVVNTTLKFKYDDGIRPIMDLYQYPDNCVDVLFLGSSHIGINIDTEQLCKEYGIAAFKLWGPTQPTWNSYYNLVEALKTQQPKVVVMETLSLAHDIEYQGYSESIKNTMGLKMSRNKIDSIIASVMPEYRLDALTGFSTYHSRYSELETVDFSSFFWNYQFDGKNTQSWYAVYQGSEPVQTDQRIPMGEKESLYLHRLLELCRRQNIQLLFVTTPYSAPEEEMARLNSARDFFQSEGYPHLDYLLDYAEIGIDFLADFGDSAGHLNSYGIQKLTHAVGKYLRENYDLPERYGDPYFAYSLPSDAIYVLQEPFAGDGYRNFVDTQIKLYENDEGAFTLLSKISTKCNSGEKIYFSCFCESPPYCGLLVRGTESGGLDIVIGDSYYSSIELPQNREWVTFGITKNGDLYQLYLDGKRIYSGVQASSGRYSGTLTLGSQWLPNNQLGKLSAVTIGELEIYSKELKESDMIRWMEEHAYIPTREEMEQHYRQQYTGELTYVLEEPFQGIGENWVDTGIQLYEEPERSWTLLAELEIPSQEDGVYAACFQEDAKDYHGLLIRKVGTEIQILVGENRIVTSRLLGGKTIRIVIAKDKDTYTVYADGTRIAQVVSACNAYVGPLMIGCELDENYQPFRQSILTVNRLEVWEGSADQTDIDAWCARK